MKKYIYLLPILLLSWCASAQQDTSGYTAQRAKINALLTERSAKFGQYDQSLMQKTGIFGLQTKRDIRNSNEILRQVVLSDNEIFGQLKVLMEYKDLQNQQVVVEANNSSERMDNYMRTIKKLQDQNIVLKTKIEKQEKGTAMSTYIIVFLILLMAGGIYFFLKKQRKYEFNKTSHKATV